ncbi:hypothetical protein [Brenneria corticis]|uniref:Uncharacterized protein n=1 Tax=Brenneria corticis TaxID=2173106 RepID=A0A2U1TMY3_9GAMM|nr:hypothetical protein [Brenneria sp. CFCC 11842]PWC10749.1 hypothetical protein DDT56_21440 [Brenneria sp. CFCC 11842]
MNLISTFSSVPYNPINSHDYVQRIARAQSLAGQDNQDASAGTSEDNEASRLAAKMLEAQIETLRQQLSTLQSRRGQATGYDSAADIISPAADGINRPTATNQINVYV